MEPRYAVFTGMLSGFSSFFGCLLVCYCAQVKAETPPDWMAGSTPAWALDAAEPVRLIATEWDFRIHRGERIQVQLALCNFSDRPLWIPHERFFVQHRSSPDGEFPSCVVEILNERGETQDFVDDLRTMTDQWRPLTNQDFYVIDPGTYRVLRHPMLNWKASASGTYMVRVTLDTRTPIPAVSESLLEGIDPTAIPCLEAMPQRRYVSNPVKIVVDP